MKLAPGTEGKERQKKKADKSRLVGGSFNKQGNLYTRYSTMKSITLEDLKSWRGSDSIPSESDLLI